MYTLEEKNPNCLTILDNLFPYLILVSFLAGYSLFKIFDGNVSHSIGEKLQKYL